MARPYRPETVRPDPLLAHERFEGPARMRPHALRPRRSLPRARPSRPTRAAPARLRTPAHTRRRRSPPRPGALLPPRSIGRSPRRRRRPPGRGRCAGRPPGSARARFLSEPCSSPSYSSSSLPVIAGSAAYRSPMRGTTLSSERRRARRSAFEIMLSMTVIGMRWLTPERWSTRLSSRARNAIRSTVSATKSGTSTHTPSRAVHDSWRVISMPVSTSSG